jgi:hypothetical protein
LRHTLPCDNPLKSGDQLRRAFFHAADGPHVPAMPKHLPPTDAELHQLEALACDATHGPWEAQVLMDYQTGESSRAVVHVAPAGEEVQPVIERDREPAEADQRYIAAVHPDAVLRLVREIRRLRRMEERYETVASVLHHLDAFLERRGLVAQAQRFVEVRAQLERISPEGAVLPDAPDGSRTAASIA